MGVFVIASNNQNKIKEISQILGSAHKVISQSEIGINTNPKESGITFKENALIKAKAVFEHIKDDNIFVLADDSGLCVDALNGEPGVKSARYANNRYANLNEQNSSDEANRQKLILELQKLGLAESSARFVACIALVGRKSGIGSKSGEILEYFAEGICEGKVITQERGKNGFGYDCVFIPNGYESTLAELSSDVKNSISHRKLALEKIKDFIENLG